MGRIMYITVKANGMSWISTISYDQATGRLKRLYDKIKGPENYIDNVLKIHSLRPHTLDAHMKNHSGHEKTYKYDDT